MVTAPEMSPASTWRITISWIRWRRSEDRPTSSGLDTGSEAVHSGNTMAGRINSRRISEVSSLRGLPGEQARVEKHRSALRRGADGAHLMYPTRMRLSDWEVWNRKGRRLETTR